MQRVFISNELTDQITLSGEDYHHLIEVLRYQKGKTFEVADKLGQVAVYEVNKINESKKTLDIKLVSKNDRDTELPVEVTLICALTKGKKIDETVEKGSEFGANHFIFYHSKYSPVKYSDEWGQKKEERLNKIALTAAKQSHRNFIPTVTVQEHLLWDELEFQTKFLAYEKASDSKSDLKERLSKIAIPSSLCCAFGPEGGFASKEVEEFIEHGFHSISLGRRILRAENAPLFFLSVLSFYFEI
ncbi:RsmE family RNA methyltransferase [Xylocopilactobacillus apis]|uniref:Ribosomal RNA small subunit methyltransferase E n=1 Tax=Xylocopilactobacillus apis TaxID=2932183 RepID=A0AAU9DKM6_9LACO|nr:RsmE family RNA methyltransferase [Xylocopilactobacillus apis]BDR56044.1 ribosomal RNA small subunit methyltransferase E [Xylocopilactobacillus apis]